MLSMEPELFSAEKCLTSGLCHAIHSLYLASLGSDLYYFFVDTSRIKIID